MLSSPAGPHGALTRPARSPSAAWPPSIPAHATRPASPPRQRRAPRAERSHPYLNRDLSWLEFNARVLHEARDPRNPLLERVKFLTIFASNLDEFFQVRIAGLRQQFEAGSVSRSPDGRTAEEQLAAARARILELVADHSSIYIDVRRALAAEGVELLEYAAIPEHHEALRQRFFDEIFPVLTPLAVDPGHPFPYISTLSLSIAVGLRDPETGERGFARVKVPQILPRLLEVEPSRFVLIDQVIEANLDALFSGMEVLEHHLFRVTRNADLALEEDEADDLLMAIEEELRRRRFGEAVRVEVERSMPAGTRAAPAARPGPERGRFLRGQRHARPHRAPPAHGPRPPGPAGPRLDARDPAPPAAARRGRARGHLRRHPRRRHPRPPPVRVVRGVGRAVHHPGRRRSRRAHDQADALPDVGRLATRPVAHPGGRTRQAGRRARRDQGPLRRGGEHRLGPEARACRRARRVRPGRAQDALEDRARRAARGLRTAPVRAHRDRQLQPEDGAPVRGPGPADRSPGDRCRRHRPVQRPDRPVAPAHVPTAARRAAQSPVAVPAARRARGGPRPGRSPGAHRAQAQRDRRRGLDRRAVRRLAGGRRDRPHHPGRLLAPAGHPGRVGEHPGPLDHRRVPRALADLVVRERRRPRVVHRVGRPDGPQPGPTRRGHRARGGCRGPRSAWRTSSS